MQAVHVIFLAMHLCACAYVFRECVPAHVLCAPSEGKITQLTKACAAQVRRIELSRATASGAVAPEFVSELLAACELEGVAKLRCCEGMLPVWNADLFVRLDALRVLNLSNCALSALPAGVLP